MVTGEVMKMNKKEWEEFAESLVDKIEEALDYFCQNITGDTPLGCYSAHQGLDLYEMASEFANWSRFGITDRDIRLLAHMPAAIYRKYTKKLQNDIEEVVNEIIEKEGPSEEYW